MTDIVDSTTRSRMMAGIKGQNTKPELLVRRALHASGFRFRLHDGRLPGKPDIVLPKWRAAIEVNGCFWHRHPGCKFATTPSTREDFWAEKFARNVQRDELNHRALMADGWRLAIVWECALKRENAGAALEQLREWITSDSLSLGIPCSL